MKKKLIYAIQNDALSFKYGDVHHANFKLTMPSSYCAYAFKLQSIMIMMTSSNGNIFRVTGHLCGEFTGHRPVTRRFDVFFDLRLINGWVNNREAGDLRRHRAHYDVIVMPRYIITGDEYRSRRYIGQWLLETYG